MNFYEILKTKKLGRGSPDYWTQLFAEHVGGKGEWTVTTLTGTLPLTFRSNGTALINYRIFGTTEGAGVQTENLFNADIVRGYYNTTNGIFIPNSARYVASGKVSINGGRKYTLSFDCDKQASSATSADGFIYFWNNNLYIHGTQFTNKELCTVTAPSDANTFAFIVGAGSSGELIPSDVTNIMLVEGSSAPASYIPYGYKLTLTVTSGTESKTADVYIGDSKLLSDDYIDYESGKIVRNGTPQDPPLPLPELETYEGTNTLDSTETLGEVTIKGQIKPQS